MSVQVQANASRILVLLTILTVHLAPLTRLLRAVLHLTAAAASAVAASVVHEVAAASEAVAHEAAAEDRIY